MKHTVAFDFETVLMRPGLKAPPHVCMTWQYAGEPSPNIVHATNARAQFERWISSPDFLIVGQNVSFDMAVAGAAWPDLVPAIFRAYEENRVADTMLRGKLLDIAQGMYRGMLDERGVWKEHRYGLDELARRFAGMRLKKDGWRLRYGEFIDIPIAQWERRAAELIEDARRTLDAGVKDKDLEAIVNGPPSDVITYPLEDARATLAVYLAQEDIRKRCAQDPFADQFRQARAAFWLHLMSAWGLRTRASEIANLEGHVVAEVQRLEKGLVEAGLVRPDGSRDTKAAVARMLDACGWEAFETSDGKTDYRPARPGARTLRRTKAGGVCLDRDACKESDDPVLVDYGDLSQLKAVLSKDVPMLQAGSMYPIHTSLDMAETGRTTSSAPNIQNLRRLPGIREAFVPRPGHVFAQADFPGLELRTLAQVCFDLFGASTLGRALNDGLDPHLAMACRILGISYDEAKKNKKRPDVDAARQTAKVANFGFPGGLGAAKLVLYAKKTYGVRITEDDARELKRTWLEQWPEMREYFAFISRLTADETAPCFLRQLRSNRIRGFLPGEGKRYTASCNSLFQGLGADATKHAGWLIAKACYVDTKSPLYGSRLVAYIHDEFLAETPDDDRAHDAAHELARLMKDGANEWLPDVPFTEVEPLLMRVWSKDAEPLPHWESKRLVPWDQDVAAALAFARGVSAFVKNRTTSLRVAPHEDGI